MLIVIQKLNDFPPKSWFSHSNKSLHAEWFIVHSPNIFENLSALYIIHLDALGDRFIVWGLGSRPVRFQQFILLYILYALHYFFFKFDFMKFVWLFYHTMTKVQPIQGRHNTTYKTIADLAKKKKPPKNPVLSFHQQDYL